MNNPVRGVRYAYLHEKNVTSTRVYLDKNKVI